MGPVNARGPCQAALPGPNKCVNAQYQVNNKTHEPRPQRDSENTCHPESHSQDDLTADTQKMPPGS